jgi:hypothetical protein
MSILSAELIVRSQPPFARITKHRDIGPAISLCFWKLLLPELSFSFSF